MLLFRLLGWVIGCFGVGWFLVDGGWREFLVPCHGGRGGVCAGSRGAGNAAWNVVCVSGTESGRCAFPR
jgi:hypothetical protein